MGISADCESVYVCTDNDAESDVKVANDDLGTNENVVVAFESKRVVGMSRDGKRYEVRWYKVDTLVFC
jgi:hypothetical protein